MRSALTLAFGALLLAAGAAHAAEPAPQYTSDEFVRAILSGPLPCPKGVSAAACEANPKTRRFSLVAPTPAPTQAPAPARAAPRRAIATAPTAPPAARPTKVSAANVLVTFAVNSAEITPQGQANLQSIAQGLNKPALAAVSFEIAGFTDATGSADANLALSQRRAEAVKAYLVTREIRAERLKTAGYGQDHLIDPNDPTSEANRRVELHRLN